MRRGIPYRSPAEDSLQGDVDKLQAKVGQANVQGAGDACGGHAAEKVAPAQLRRRDAKVAAADLARGTGQPKRRCHVRHGHKQREAEAIHLFEGVRQKSVRQKGSLGTGERDEQAEDRYRRAASVHIVARLVVAGGRAMPGRNDTCTCTSRGLNAQMPPARAPTRAVPRWKHGCRLLSFPAQHHRHTNIEEPFVVERDADACGVPQQDQTKCVHKLQQHRIAAQVALWEAGEKRSREASWGGEVAAARAEGLHRAMPVFRGCTSTANRPASCRAAPSERWPF